ncbi:MAG TPA: C45 family autoproteolytic acyltransferase/hydrolase [Candidatus Brocadiia bacterium]|nr:C45 family autoproteolytic acyltransferase/hydrolase [Candidatus Brocadiia bacterium]
MIGSHNAARGGIIPRQIPEGVAPLVDVAGTAFECGQRYAAAVMAMPRRRSHLETMRQYLAQWPRPVIRLIEDRAPFLVDVLRGMASETAGLGPAPPSPRDTGGCTSFGVSGALALDGAPLSGQNKDTPVESAFLYIVLKMRIQAGPTILVLAYPGELLGYGLWSTGLSLFRNSLYCPPSPSGLLTLESFGLLALASGSVDAAIDLARTHGVQDNGNVTISDASGKSAAVEWDARGVTVVEARDGVVTHANHAEAPALGAVDVYPDPEERRLSEFRSRRLRELLQSEHGRLTSQKAMMILADHEGYPGGLCRHKMDGSDSRCTTAALVAEHSRGVLHVVRGQACSHWPVTHTISA